FRHGATSVLFPGRPEPGAVFATIAQERPTVFYGVPSAYAAMLATDGEHDVSSVRLFVSAGEALPRPIFERWKARFGAEILDGIGSTEIGYIAISNFAGRARAGTSGEVIPGYEAKVAGADGAPVESGEVGDLMVRGPSTALCYWHKREATKQTFRGQWVFTGDRYSVDAAGYHTYQGRSDDLLKVGGIWVSPLEVETALLEHGAVRECAVVGRELEIAADRLLIDVIRDDCGATGTKLGCGVGICGTCSVLVDGELVSACLVPAVFVDGRSLTTVEGLAQDGELTPLQDAFIRDGGFQCGICTPGQLIAA